jgi:hypothetical protein
VDTLLAPVRLIGGFVVGSLVIAQITRWAALVCVSAGRHGGDFLGAPKRRLLWVLPFALLLHPALYLVGSVIFLMVAILRGKVGIIWFWFLGGLYVYIVVSGLVLLRAYRFQSRRPIAAGPNKR